MSGRIVVEADIENDRCHELDPDGHHIWRPVFPRARISVLSDCLPEGGWRGEAYHDFNAGDRPVEADFQGWDWARGRSGGDAATILYDAVLKDGRRHAIGLTYADDGRSHCFSPPPRNPLPAGLWGVRGGIACDATASPQLVRRLEDTPFYNRALVRTSLSGRASHHGSRDAVLQAIGQSVGQTDAAVSHAAPAIRLIGGFIVPLFSLVGAGRVAGLPQISALPEVKGDREGEDEYRFDRVRNSAQTRLAAFFRAASRRARHSSLVRDCRRNMIVRKRLGSFRSVHAIDDVAEKAVAAAATRSVAAGSGAAAKSAVDVSNSESFGERARIISASLPARLVWARNDTLSYPLAAMADPIPS